MDEVEVRLCCRERIVEIGRELVSTNLLERLLQRIVEAAAELTCTEPAGILLDREGGGTVFRISCLAPAPKERG